MGWSLWVCCLKLRSNRLSFRVLRIETVKRREKRDQFVTRCRWAICAVENIRVEAQYNYSEKYPVQTENVFKFLMMFLVLEWPTHNFMKINRKVPYHLWMHRIVNSRRMWNPSPYFKQFVRRIRNKENKLVIPLPIWRYHFAKRKGEDLIAVIIECYMI